MSNIVLTKEGVPTIEDFASGTGPPLIIDLLTGTPYTVMIGDTVVPVTGTAGPEGPQVQRDRKVCMCSLDCLEKMAKMA